ncbi:MAG: hypothetical protein M1272_08420, partial [Firmicutes bacterium]|nr:hypothetical protein [Bacillota bacterium]
TPVAVFNAQTPVPGPQSEGPGLSPISQLNFQSPAQGNAVVSLGAGACQAGYAVLATPDGGGHWTATTPSPILAQDGPVATSFPQGGSGPGWFVNGSCAGAYVQVFKRSSGGKVWTHLTNVPTANLSPNALNFRMTTSQTGYLVDASNGYGPHASMLELNLTQDGGAHWTQSTLPSQGLPNNITQLSFTSPHQGWVVTAQQNQPFHVYALSGTGWTAMATPDSSANTPPLADRVSGRIGYLAQNTSQGISLFKTVDGGQEWIPLTFPSR